MPYRIRPAPPVNGLMAHPYHPAPARRPPRRRRWARILVIAVVLFGVLLWFAPTLVAKTALRDRLLAAATTDLNGSVTADDASFGWLSPVELRGVVLKDSDGNEFARAERVVSERSLLALMQNSRAVGVIRVEKPVVDLVCGEKETNVETAFAKYFAPSSMPSAGPIALTIHVTDGTLTVRNPDRSVSHTLSAVAGDVTIPAAKAEPITIVANAGTNPADSLKVDMAFGETSRVRIDGDAVPLAVVGLIAKWFEPSMSLNGIATAHVGFDWSEKAFSVDGTVRATNVEWAAKWLGPDRLRFATLDLPAKFTVAGSTLTAETVRLNCDAGTVSVSGAVDLSGDFDAIGRKAGLKADADVNLTKLAATLPRLLRLRPGTELSGGQLKVSVASAAGPSGVVWTGELGTSAIRAVRDGKPVVWDQPLRAGFAVRLGPDGWPVFDKLEAQSDFIGLAARGSAESFVSAANIDLNKLAARLRDFVDLDGVQLAGLAEVTLNSKAVAGGFAVDAKAKLTRFAVMGTDGIGLREPELGLTLAAEVKRDAKRIGLPSGRLILTAAGDSAEVVLTEPIADIAKLTSGRATLSASGDLARWQSRLSPFFVLSPDLALHGQGKLTGSVAVANRTAGFDGSLAVDKLVLGPPVKPTWSEPTLTLAAKGELDVAGDAVRFDRLRVERDGLAADAAGSIRDLSTTQNVKFDGTLAYDLARLEPKLREFLGKGATVRGADRRPFRVAGKLGGQKDVVAGLTGSAAVAWQSLKAYGFDVGPADLTVTLDAGVATISPIAATFGGGQVRVTPRVDLSPATLSFARGRVIDRAKLTPAACADAIGFALPVIAKATQSEGTISFDLAENRVPLGDPTRAAMKGTLTLHAVKVSPGPVATELATLLGATNVTLTLANEQAVAVRVDGGRVYHDNLEIDVRGYRVKTSGSVGFDGSLNLTADLPLPDRLIGQLLKDRPLIKEALSKKRVAVTIGGTIDRPQVDPKALQAAVQKLTQEAVKSAADEALKKGLQGILPPKK